MRSPDGSRNKLVSEGTVRVSAKSAYVRTEVLCGCVGLYLGYAMSSDEFPFSSVCTMRDCYPLVRILC